MVKIPFPRRRFPECKAGRHSNCSGYQSPEHGAFGPTIQCDCSCHIKKEHIHDVVPKFDILKKKKASGALKRLLSQLKKEKGKRVSKEILVLHEKRKKQQKKAQGRKILKRLRKIKIRLS